MLGMNGLKVLIWSQIKTWFQISRRGLGSSPIASRLIIKNINKISYIFVVLIVIYLLFLANIVINLGEIKEDLFDTI
jgi:hypothetical protein